ncbi:TPA: DNA cytosine methyltransferase [Klebsiella pneumoniae]|nr:DNA cytosine methyltransferase [Klebsiella pneumoniae]ELB4297077.1 DNA cytosine methyltransferase [Klebsiella pneumoniae]
MTPSAYYNEIDPFAAQWLRNLIAAGHIAPGEVDERSIEDVTPDDLRGFTQCHFFAGIGVWSHSLRLAGWPDDRPVWTGSCPCQPFSAAGKGDGFADERHLWPHFFHLISERRPQHVFGEQVASGNANTWFDLVQADLEGMGYAFGLVPFTSAGIGAPHIRERAYWVANADSVISDRRGNLRAPGRDEYSDSGDDGRLGNSNVARLEGLSGNDCAAGRERATGPAAAPGVHDGMANTTGQLHHECNDGANEFGRSRDAEQNRLGGEPVRALEVNGFWRDADWLFCRDGKWRPVEPGTFPLVNGASSRLVRKQPGVAGLARMASRNRTGRLKGYGNAINAQAASAFIRAYMGVQDGQ